MTHSPPPSRSPELMSRGETALLMVDMQEKLLPHIAQRDVVVWNVRRLIEGAHVLGLPVAATEQYPRGLGRTVPELAEPLAQRSIPEKLTFSCRECWGIFQSWRDRGIVKILVCGVEAHVCVQQTVLDLLNESFRVYVAVDAVSSRFPLDCQIALRRLENSGATLTTTEAALFEWCEVAGSEEFKRISRLVRESAPQPGGPAVT